ncbi:hypothetical protein UPYG_G00149160 [Umbra pygmaea]|uniref:CHHC U11-48K-type domain-containing protein n=1 Tax=Umbra pygmaea TaxID=75934 RepID=A0ABD0WX39_UMBPY
MCDSPEKQTLQARLQSLEELTEFTENCQRQLNELFETLGWRQDMASNGSNRETMEVCPYDPNHRVPSRSMERHQVSCYLTQMGYSHEEQAAMCDPSVCYENTNIGSFTMDKHTQQQVILQARSSAPPIRTEGLYSQSDFSTDPPEVPQNHKRATCDLTVADRLSLYDYVTREASQRKDEAGATNNEDLYVDLVAKLKKDNDQKEPKSHLELMAEMRDYKRRRQSYRAKNVHITKKSYTEVIREVISVHSSELSSQWNEESQEDKGSKPGTHRRSASTESHHSHISSRDRHISHHKSQDRGRDKSQGRGRDKSQDHGRDKSQDRGRDKSQDRGRDKSQDRGRDKSQERGRDKSQERGRDKSQDHGQDKSQDRGRDKSQERGRDKSQERGRDKSQDKSQDRGRDKSQDKSQDRGRDKSQDKSQDRGRDKSQDKSQERGRDRSQERGRDRSQDRGRDRSQDRGQDRSQDRGRDRSQDRGREIDGERKESKKKRKRDCRSPDEKHDRKKKKKKKKEEEKRKLIFSSTP